MALVREHPALRTAIVTGVGDVPSVYADYRLLGHASFGRLGMSGRSTPFPVRGLHRVRVRGDLTILARLACALTRARAVPLAA